MARKDYGNEDIVVHWDAPRCIHTGICTRALPGVFDVNKRPWIDVNGADADAVAEATELCPTGALRYERRDGSNEQVPDVTTVVPMRDGPLYLRGTLRVTAPDGTLIAEETRLALCRCGATANPPFCDNSHRASGYRSADPGGVPGVAEPESPADICPPQDLDAVTRTGHRPPAAPSR